MSRGGFRNNVGGGARVVVDIPYNPAPIPAGVLSQPRLPSSTSLSKYMFSSPGLSLGLANLDGQGEMMNRPGPIDFDRPGRNREDEYESRSGSDNLEGGSGDDLDFENQPLHKRKRYHRHTPQQIQELEALFKECPHPDEKQRLELSKRLNLESRQVKFWFQNRRTQMKTQLERHENALLRQENDRLKAENISMREAMRNPICTNCGGPAMLSEATAEEQHLRIENARLRDELERVCTLAAKFLRRPIPAMGMPNSSLELAVGGNELNPTAVTANNTHSTPLTPASNPVNGIAAQMGSIDRSLERSMYLELALAAMDELVKMVQIGEPLWLPGAACGKDVLNDEEYTRLFSRARPVGMVSEATRETGTVIINSEALVETLMDANQWADMFPCIVTKASTTDVISNGVGATRSGALQLMHAELQVLSPLVPIRETNFLRFCKQHAEGVWAVVDVSIDGIHDGSPATPPGYMSCRRLPSGCVVQDMPNGCSKVTWVEHAEYDETPVHQLYRAVLRSGMAFGASRWVSTLNRQSQCLAILMSSSSMPSRDHAAITPAGRRSMLKLAHRMTDNFCAGVCPSTSLNWNRLTIGTIDEDVRVMTRKSVDDPGEPPGVVLSAATSVWLPVSPRRLFDFLRDERLRSEWDILSNGGPMQEMAHIAKGQDPGNCVSLLRASTPGVNQSSMLIVQETCTDASGSLVVYAPVDIPAMHVVMSGGDSGCVALLPSGFAIIPDLAPQQQNDNSQDEGRGSASPPQRESGSLLTVAFQILVNSLPTAKLTVESVETVSNLITCTVQKIKASFHREDC